MRTRIKLTDLIEAQWHFVQRFVGTEYPLDGTAVRVCYEFAPTVEFNTVMPLAKFHEIQGHLLYIGDGTRVEADQAKAREILELIQKISSTIDEMRQEMREATGHA